jgi:hypothetical protein
MTVAVDSTLFSIDFAVLVDFIGKNYFPDGDSNPRPFGLIFGIKTPNRILAFRSIRILESLPIKY